MAKDRIFFLISLAVLGILAAFLFRGDDDDGIILNSKSKGKNVENNADYRFVEVMVAKKKLKVGDQLEAGTYKWQKIDSKEHNPSLLMRNQKTEQWIKEAVVLRDVKEGEQLKRLDILWPQESDNKNEVAYVLPAKYGKRAIPYIVEEKSAVVQFVKPGMFVDVIFSTDKDIGYGTISLTLMKNIRILAVAEGNILNDKVVKDGPSNILLEMNPKQAEIFSYGVQSGNITLGLIQKGTASINEKTELSDLLQKSQSIGNFKSTLATYLIRSHFPNVDVKISSTNKGFIISGTIHEQQVAAKIKEILVKMSDKGEEDVVDLMVVKPQQVLICVKVLEVSKDVHCKYGINWQALFESSGKSVALAAIFPRPLSADPNYFLEAKNIAAGDFTLSGVIDMLQEDGIARVIAEPNLTTISGKTAEFFAGGEFPILIPQGGNLIGTVTVEFKKFGVILEFTPYVDLNGLITLHIVPEVSTIDKQNAITLSGFVIPSLITRRADTTVKLWPGQCYAIAGLMQYERVARVSGLYGLNKLPIIGALFNSRDFTDRRTELMILLTPYLIYADEEDYSNEPCCPAHHG